MPASFKTLFTLACAAAFGGFAALAVHQAVVDAPVRAAPAADRAPAVAALPVAVDGQALPSLAPMLQRVTPAVVSVQTEQRIRVSPFGDDPYFRRLFPELTQERINRSLGSGVIVDAERGLVLTNHHVIEGAEAVSVTLADGSTVAARFVGSDPDTDVALMRIPPEAIESGAEVRLTDSDTLRVGDFVVAVGNPFGIGQTVTSGIVSAVGRSGLRGLGYQNFIQTDASINPGNSGGALVNLRGELVGINTASFNPRGSAAGNIGLGFAIPSNLARNVMQQLLEGGVVRRGALGIDTRAIDARLADGLGLDAARGALVARVYPDSGAAAAGLRVGDVVVAANGERIDGPMDLHNFEGLQPVGSRVTLDIRRDGRPLQLAATLREQPRSLPGAALDPRLEGAVFADLPERLRQAGVAGVWVESVAPRSAAARNGLRRDDVVLAANTGAFDDLAGFRGSLTDGDDPRLVLRILRDGRQGNLLVQ
jgi:Do/DeqQ family serine protease